MSTLYDPHSGEETGVDVSAEHSRSVLPGNFHLKSDFGQEGGSRTPNRFEVQALLRLESESDPAVKYEEQARYREAVGVLLERQYPGLKVSVADTLMRKFGYDINSASQFTDFLNEYSFIQPVPGKFLAYSKEALAEWERDAASYWATGRFEQDEQYEDLAARVTEHHRRQDVVSRLRIISPRGKGPSFSKHDYSRTQPREEMVVDLETFEILPVRRNIPLSLKPEVLYKIGARFKYEQRSAAFNGNGNGQYQSENNGNGHAITSTSDVSVSYDDANQSASSAVSDKELRTIYPEAFDPRHPLNSTYLVSMEVFRELAGDSTLPVRPDEQWAMMLQKSNV